MRRNGSVGSESGANPRVAVPQKRVLADRHKPVADNPQDVPRRASPPEKPQSPRSLGTGSRGWRGLVPSGRCRCRPPDRACAARSGGRSHLTQGGYSSHCRRTRSPPDSVAPSLAPPTMVAVDQMVTIGQSIARGAHPPRLHAGRRGERLAEAELDRGWRRRSTGSTSAVSVT